MKKNRIVPVVGVLLGEAHTSTRADLIADTYRKCPYCVTYVSAGCTVIGVFSLPTDHRWWLEWAAEQPEDTLGLKYVEVFFTQGIKVSSPWSQGNVKPNLNQAPCGADCQECNRYHKGCRGCPSTQYYVSA